jgi:hypothetical protein
MACCLAGWCAVASLLQAVLGLMRPDSSTKLHRTWYHLHSSAGRLNAAAGIINMFIGTALMHQIQVRRRRCCCGAVCLQEAVCSTRLTQQSAQKGSRASRRSLQGLARFCIVAPYTPPLPSAPLCSPWLIQPDTLFVLVAQASGFWAWFLPALACAALVLAAAVALEVKMVDLERRGLFKPSHHLYRSKLKDPFLAPLKANIGKQGSGSFDGGRTPRSGDSGGAYSTGSTPLASVGSMDLFRRRRSTASGMGSWPGMSQGAGGGGGLPSHLRPGGGAGADPQQVAISYV